VTRDQFVLLALGALTLVCVLLVVALVRLRARASRAAAELIGLRDRLDELAGRPGDMPAAAPVTAPVEYLITDLGREQPPVQPVQLDGPAFVDIVVKEAVVKAASFAQGLRRGLAPATRNRIRFEMKQEVRRARKQRRADLKAAARDLHARQRAAMAAGPREAS
jgi:hypothetical protein